VFLKELHTLFHRLNSFYDEAAKIVHTSGARIFGWFVSIGPTSDGQMVQMFRWSDGGAVQFFAQM